MEVSNKKRESICRKTLHLPVNNEATFNFSWRQVASNINLNLLHFPEKDIVEGKKEVQINSPGVNLSHFRPSEYSPVPRDSFKVH